MLEIMALVLVILMHQGALLLITWAVLLAEISRPIQLLDGSFYWKCPKLFIHLQFCAGGCNVFRGGADVTGEVRKVVLFR